MSGAFGLAHQSGAAVVIAVAAARMTNKVYLLGPGASSARLFWLNPSLVLNENPAEAASGRAVEWHQTAIYPGLNGHAQDVLTSVRNENFQSGFSQGFVTG